MKSSYDMVVKHGNVVSFEPDVINRDMNIGIKNGKIADITKNDIEGKSEINAEGMYVVPGLIDFHSHVNGRRFSAECLMRQGFTTTIGGERIFDTKVIRDIETDGFLINHGFYISYSFNLRKAVGLNDPLQIASRQEISSMMRLAERFFEFGVFGIHFSLEYAPGTSEEELEGLFRIARQHGKTVIIHLRKDGYEAMESLEEVIRVARKTGAAVHIVHVMYTAGLEGVLDVFLKRIEDACSEGCDITADTGVYSAYPTFSGSMSLGKCWEAGYGKDISERNLMISSGVHAGKFCDEKLFAYIRKEFPATLITAFVYDESQISKAIRPDYMFISTNAAYGPHHDNIGHPEGSGTFPKLIAQYVRNEKAITLQDAVKKMTYLPAKRLDINNKGNLRKGMDADILIFDYSRIESKADYVGFGDPNAAPEGINYVIIGGNIVKDIDGTISDQNSGILIKRR